MCTVKRINIPCDRCACAVLFFLFIQTMRNALHSLRKRAAKDRIKCAETRFKFEGLIEFARKVVCKVYTHQIQRHRRKDDYGSGLYYRSAPVIVQSIRKKAAQPMLKVEYMRTFIFRILP